MKAAGRGLFGRGYVFLPSQSETLTIPNLLRAKIEGLDRCPLACTDDVGGDLFKLVKEVHCFTRETYGLANIIARYPSPLAEARKEYALVSRGPQMSVHHTSQQAVYIAFKTKKLTDTL